MVCRMVEIECDGAPIQGRMFELKRYRQALECVAAVLSEIAMKKDTSGLSALGLSKATCGQALDLQGNGVESEA